MKFFLRISVTSNLHAGPRFHHSLQDVTRFRAAGAAIGIDRGGVVKTPVTST